MSKSMTGTHCGSLRDSLKKAINVPGSQPGLPGSIFSPVWPRRPTYSIERWPPSVSHKKNNNLNNTLSCLFNLGYLL